VTTTSAIAPYIPTYGNWNTYLTIAEYENAPTAMDTMNLIPGGSAQANAQALQETIARASSWIDGFVTGSAYSTLNASSNVENARIWGNRLGQLRIHPRLWPILELQSFSYSNLATGPGSSASITPQGNIWIEPQEFIVYPRGLFNLGINVPVGITTVEYYCTYQYINGFPNTTLSASVAAAASSVTVQSGLGVYPGTQLTVFDSPNDEQVTVASNFIPDTTLIPLTVPLSSAHPIGATLTNLPKSVKQAAILATTAFIKQRGSGALVAADIGEVTRTQTGFSQNAGSDWAQAKELLNPLKQQYIGW
jgi:hypothetical protein